MTFHYIDQNWCLRNFPLCFFDTHECVLVLREFRQVATILETDPSIKSSRLPTLLQELRYTLQIYSSDRESRRTILDHLEHPRKSSSSDDRSLVDARTRFIRDGDARRLAINLRDAIHNICAHYYRPVRRHVVLFILHDDHGDEDQERRNRITEQAVLNHCAALFDSIECELDLFSVEEDKASYIRLLSDVIQSELRPLLQEEFYMSVCYSENLMNIRNIMASELTSVGRKKSNAALKGLHEVGKSTWQVSKT